MLLFIQRGGMCLKILSIGNSFSHDAHKWLHKLAKMNNVDIETANLFIGGCSLKTHWENIEENNAFYDYEINGNHGEYQISIAEALGKDKWDIVTVQQASQYSGLFDSYEPYLTNIIKTVKNALPDAKIYFHQTWAYEIDSEHSGFAYYNNDQRNMFNCILKASEQAAKLINAPMIPVGRAVQYVRENVHEFDYAHGGLSLCRDGFHMSYDYGRFLAASVWLKTLSGVEVTAVNFEDFDNDILKKLLNVVNSDLF